MPTSATGRTEPRRRRVRRGFTLLEVLVVLAIVAVLASLAVLSTGGVGSRRVERAAERAEALLALACERAASTGRDVGVAVLADGLRFGYLLPQGFRPMPDDPADPLRPRALGESITLTLTRDGERLAAAEDPPASAQLACLASGELTPFVLSIEGGDQRFELRGSIDGQLALRRDGDGRPRAR